VRKYFVSCSSDVDELMPVRRVKGGYRWGSTGKVYRTQGAAQRQGRAIEMAKMKKRKTKRRGGK